jgi:glycosyltransferase involved in cell wall biosynthesis
LIRKNVSFGVLKAIDFEAILDCNLPFSYPQFGILKEILKFKPDVIHVVEHTPAAMLCGILAKILDIPLVCSSHTHIDSYIPLYIYSYANNYVLRTYQHLRRVFLNMADCNLSVSSDFAQILNRGGTKSPIHVWKTGVDSELFNPKYRSHNMRLKMFNGNYSPHKVLLVSVGRISPEKNFDFLLNILKSYPQTFLCIIGDGPYKSCLKPLFPPDQTHFMGFLQGEELASAYASADLFVYASMSETFGQVYLEAMSCGVPVVAAEGSQMKEFFKNGVHGYTWKSNDLNEAYKAVEKAICEREILANNCRLNALNHSWDCPANQISILYCQFESYKQQKDCLRVMYRTLKYFGLWVYIIILLLTMAPFVKVIKPVSKHNKRKDKVYTRLKRLDFSAVSALIVSLVLTAILLTNNFIFNTNLFCFSS